MPGWASSQVHVLFEQANTGDGFLHDPAHSEAERVPSSPGAVCRQMAVSFELISQIWSRHGPRWYTPSLRPKGIPSAYCNQPPHDSSAAAACCGLPLTPALPAACSLPRVSPALLLPACVPVPVHADRGPALPVSAANTPQQKRAVLEWRCRGVCVAECASRSVCVYVVSARTTARLDWRGHFSDRTYPLPALSLIRCIPLSL